MDAKFLVVVDKVACVQEILHQAENFRGRFRESFDTLDIFLCLRFVAEIGSEMGRVRTEEVFLQSKWTLLWTN